MCVEKKNKEKMKKKNKETITFTIQLREYHSYNDRNIVEATITCITKTTINI